MNIGFIGVGNLGKSIVQRLLDRGHSLKVLDILSVGGGDSLVFMAKKDKLLNEDFSTHFSNALIYKDLNCLQDLTYEQKIPLFTGSIIKELFARTFVEGIDKKDFSSVYKIFKKKKSFSPVTEK